MRGLGRLSAVELGHVADDVFAATGARKVAPQPAKQPVREERGLDYLGEIASTPSEPSNARLVQIALIGSLVLAGVLGLGALITLVSIGRR